VKYTWQFVSFPLFYFYFALLLIKWRYWSDVLDLFLDHRKFLTALLWLSPQSPLYLRASFEGDCPLNVEKMMLSATV
jgi:hypothetical protein